MKKNALLPADTAQSLKLADLSTVPPSGIVSRTLLQTPELRIVHFVIDEGQELTTHSSPHRAVVQILDGSCDFLFNGEWQRLEAGALLHMPPNHPHALKAQHGPLSMLLTLGISPAGAGRDATKSAAK